MVDKIFLNANELLADSFLLAHKIYDAGLKPDWIIGVWRGGTPIAIAVHELFYHLGHKSEHMAIQARSYTGIKTQATKIKLRGIQELIRYTKDNEQILLIDDVFDTGLSLKAIINELQQHTSKLKITTATVWYKPENNKTNITPDFYLKTTDKWIVFPHELTGLSEEELKLKNINSLH